jgi:hypothetical protein
LVVFRINRTKNQPAIALNRQATDYSGAIIRGLWAGIVALFRRPFFMLRSSSGFVTTLLWLSASALGPALLRLTLLWPWLLLLFCLLLLLFRLLATLRPLALSGLG